MMLAAFGIISSFGFLYAMNGSFLEVTIGVIVLFFVAVLGFGPAAVLAYTYLMIN